MTTQPNTSGNNMSTKIDFRIRAALLFLLVVLLMAHSKVSAQSGRVIPKPPTPPVESRAQPEAKPKFIPDPNADKYKIIFATGYEDKLLYKELPKDKKQRKEIEREREEDAERRSKAYRASLVDQLNRAGEEGYRLFSIVSYPFIAIMKKDEIQYEYAWFRTTSSCFFARSEFEEEYPKLAEQGFSLADHMISGAYCEVPDGDENSALATQNCSYSDLFILERVKGDDRPKQFSFIRHIPSWGALKGESVLTVQANDALVEGLYPTHAICKHEVVLHRRANINKLSTDKIDMKVVTGNVEKKVNQLAQQGYRIAVIQSEIAIMFREGNTTAPTGYFGLSAKKKDFEQQLTVLQDKGAIYRMTYPARDGVEDKLIFELPSTNVKHREYKVLNLELQRMENVEEKRVEIDLTLPSKEKVKLFKQLVNEGFEVRDLFSPGIYRGDIDKVCLLLER